MTDPMPVTGPLTDLQQVASNLIQVTAYIVMVILLLRFFFRGHYMYGHGEVVAALFNVSEKICRPLRLFLPSSWFGVKDYVPLVGAGLILLLKPFVQAAALFIPIGEADPALASFSIWIKLSTYFFETGVFQACTIAAVGGSILLFLAFCWQQAGRFYSVFYLQMLDEVTLPYLTRVAFRFKLSHPWTVVAAGILQFNLYCGVVSALLLLLSELLFYLIMGDTNASFSFATGLLTAVAAIGYILIYPLMMLAGFMGIICMIFIIMNWFLGFDRGLQEKWAFPYMLLQAIAGPPLNWARRLCPWATIGPVDLSPILFFISLWVVKWILLLMLEPIMVWIISAPLLAYG
jgi:YGGT family